ncbi:MAG: glycosyltransferase [Halobacteriales archaeon]
MGSRVCAFTDTYLPTVNGVTYTVKTWREAWNADGGRMDVVYPDAEAHEPASGEHPVPSVRFPFYDGYRLGVPTLPQSLNGVDVVHAHTPFSLGLAALRLVRQTGRPLVTSFHTPADEYTPYLAGVGPVASGLSAVSRRYERWFFEHADAVIAPSQTAATDLRSDIGVTSEIRIVSNGVDLDFFCPVDGDEFRRAHDLPMGPLIGYTGRHGYEKRLADLLQAVSRGDDDWTVVFGGGGPATADLEALAADLGVDARFLGFLDRSDLPAFYSAIDVFAFPSPVETQGLVALEAMACATPVVGVAAGALRETLEDGVTGLHYPEGDLKAFADRLRRALEDRDDLAEACLDRRASLGIERSMDQLEAVYAEVLDGNR